MELYNFYSIAHITMQFFVSDDPKMWVVGGVFFGVMAWIALFVLQGIGIYTMAKRVNLGKRLLAFVPFANLYYLGKIVGDCHFFGQKMKRVGLYVMIAQIVSTVVTVAYVLAELYLVWYYPPMLDELGSMYWVGLTGVADKINSFREIGGYLMSIFSLVTQILFLIMMIGLFKKYAPGKQSLLSLLTFFAPPARFICIFVLRNREPFDYEAYMRRRYEEYVRRQQQYHNPYGNPYGGSPYGMGGYQGTQGGPTAPQKPEEPFGEFTGGEQSSPQENSQSTGDGFFD